MLTLRKALALTVLAGACLFTSTASAQSYQHIDRLAYQLQRQSSSLYSEFRAHFSHTPGYRHLMSDTAKMYRLARHIHDLVHHHEDVHHIVEDLDQLDAAFHHVEELVDQIEHNAHHHGHGHVHGDTRHVRRLLQRMEDTLHHLREDLGG